MAINAGVPQGSVLSATLFLLHINDLLKPGTFGYADDSTVAERYTSSARASGSQIQSLREAMVGRLNSSLEAVSAWGNANLVEFNAAKTQACLFSAKRSQFSPAPTFRGAAVPITDCLDILGVTLTSTLNFGPFIEAKAHLAAKKLGILAKVRQYFTQEQLLKLYQAQVRSCMEYCSHLWDGSARYQLDALEAIERRAKRIIGNDALVESKLQSLEHRRRVASLSVFYRLHFGESEWRQRLSQPRAGLAVIAAISPLFEEWLERRHGVLTYRLTQVLTGHGSFGRFLFLIGREETPGCHHCEDRPEDTVEHTVALCPAWAEHRRVLRDVVGDGDLSRPALVQAMVRSEGDWDAVSSFCEAVMLAKEEAGRVRERTSSRPSRRERHSGRRGSRDDLRPP
ncbi:uncharacterized protein LOC126912962 [Spodoptera frugiperda]|uniref:Uncharacterized protein LOC126912962 n=1 Tax=Spodoptera frugiperda TaxID=7108 RepID=A0A9R0F748_SPOFR|nr:uncharacterized protein LOC126912962 [Spodoptera frugiperda]